MEEPGMWQLERKIIQPSRQLSLDDFKELGLQRVKLLHLCHSAIEMVRAWAALPRVLLTTIFGVCFLDNQLLFNREHSNLHE